MLTMLFSYIKIKTDVMKPVSIIAIWGKYKQIGVYRQ